MRYQPLPASFHAANRAEFAKSIGLDAIAIIDTADEQARTADCNFPSRPDSNFYYLTGIDQPEAVLVLVPGAADTADRELLFVRETNEFIATWEGARYDRSQAAALSGVEQVFWTSELESTLKRLVAGKAVYVNMPHKHAGLKVQSALPQLTRQRVIKAPEELAQIRRAIEVTKTGLERIEPLLKAGVFEYEIEAELIRTFTAVGAQHAFSPIVAAGAGSTVLHYIKNDQKLASNDLVLLDVGAEYGWYAADISRTIPVGEFSERKTQVYEAVQRVQQAAIGLIKPGIIWREYEKRVVELVGRELVALGVLTLTQTKGEAGVKTIRRYYPHSVSHFMGLDAHDVGERDGELVPGMVISCEPGIYLHDEGIGVRLEDDILITETGNENLSAAIK